MWNLYTFYRHREVLLAYVEIMEIMKEVSPMGFPWMKGRYLGLYGKVFYLFFKLNQQVDSPSMI